MASNFARRINSGIASWLVAVAITTTGCTALPDKALVPPFRQGVTAVSQQTTESLNEINAFFRQQQIERVITLPNLAEEDFLAGIDPEDIAKWGRAFSIIDAYASALSKLLSDAGREGIEEELAGVVTKANAMADGQVPPDLSAVFVRLAGRLLQIKAEQEALEILRAADPAIQDVFGEMMTAIGEDHESGLRGTVWTSWAQILNRINVKEFRATGSDREKRSAAIKFVRALEERDAQDAKLASIRLSLSSLAGAHSKMAEGRTLSAAGLIDIAQGEYLAFRTLVDTNKRMNRDQGAQQ